jgi:3',5'-cyclic AMP phosphodiesterase CpdA
VTAALRAVSDLHIAYAENRDLVDSIRPQHPGDWLLVAGDVAERLTDIEWALATLRERFACVIWTPGNHELWTLRDEFPQLVGAARYERLVRLCRDLDVVTPEDQFHVWSGAGGPVTVAPLFLLYDYSFLSPGSATVAESYAKAEAAGIVCTDEYFLHPDPYPSRAEWCAARVEYSRRRLDEVDGMHPLVLVTHWPLVRHPTAILRHPEFAQWCGTTRTADWHTRYDVAAAVYGHLHIPQHTVHDGVRFQEVSVGYPREWKRFGLRRPLAQQVLPAPRPGSVTG